MEQRLFAKDLGAQKINLALTGRLGHNDFRDGEVAAWSDLFISKFTVSRISISRMCSRGHEIRGRLYRSIERVMSCYMSGIKLQYCLLPFSLSLCIPLFHSIFSSCPPRNRLKLEGFR